MEFVCNLETLTSAIVNVSIAVAPKSGLSALEGVLAVAKNGKVTLTGYNLEVGITTEIEADITKEGEIVIPAKLFSDILRKSDSDIIEISVNERLMIDINVGKSHYNIIGISPLEFPELPTMKDGKGFAIDKDLIKSMINQTLFAVSSSDAKPIHTGELFVIGDNSITLVAVDGFRLAMRKEKIAISENHQFVVPGKTLADLLKLIDGEGEMLVEICDKHIMFVVDDYCIISRLLEGQFLDYKTSISGASNTTVVVNTRELMNSIERTSLLISEKIKNPLRVRFEENSILMSCSTSIGKASDECVSSLDGTPLEMGFNNKYLMDALKYADTDMVQMKINNAISPMKIVPLEGDGFLFLVLPMRLKAE